MARSRRDAPPQGACRWQNAREMRSPTSDSGKISLWCVFGGGSRGEIMPRCVFGRQSVAAFSLHAFPKGPFSLREPLRSCTARGSCHSWVLRLSALIFLRQGAVLAVRALPPALYGRRGCFAGSPTCGFELLSASAQDAPVAAPPACAALRPVRVAGSACLVAHKQLLLARSPVVASASRPNWQ